MVMNHMGQMAKNKGLCSALICLIIFLVGQKGTAQHMAQNPMIYADVPDVSMIRVHDTYYMSSTTMHMSPGVPILKSKDLVNWELVNYAYSTLEDTDELNLSNGKNAYGRGSWASSLRYSNGKFYVSTFSGTTNKTYIYITDDIEHGPWLKKSFAPAYHDNSIFFEEGHIYMIWGSGKLKIMELKDDLSGPKIGTEKILIENASAPAGSNIGLKAEGSQLFKIKGYYYLFNIVWPKNGMRTVIVHRADKISGPYEGKLTLQDKGVAQGGLIDTPDGHWFSYLFRDYGAVGRVPYLVPVKWQEGWPILGIRGKVPDTLDLPMCKGLLNSLVASDDFDRKEEDRDLPLVWQWNHNPDSTHWSVRERRGYLRLTTAKVASNFTTARNTLTQRTVGPESSGTIAMDIAHMKEGDFAGLGLLQKKYGWVGVRNKDGQKQFVMVNTDSGEEIEFGHIPIDKRKVYLKAECEFGNKKDMAYFFYSTDGISWKRIGTPLKMQYTLPHFMGYRFALFNYATMETGGYVDFDFFHISDRISKME